MPYDDPDPSDPNMLVGVVLAAGAEAMRDMAYVFAEEFARMGFDADGIFGVFREPFYAGAHQAYRELGEEAVREIVRECVAVFGRTAARIDEPSSALQEGHEALLWPTVSSAVSGADEASSTDAMSTGRGGE